MLEYCSFFDFYKFSPEITSNNIKFRFATLSNIVMKKRPVQLKMLKKLTRKVDRSMNVAKIMLQLLRCEDREIDYKRLQIYHLLPENKIWEILKMNKRSLLKKARELNISRRYKKNVKQLKLEIIQLLSIKHEKDGKRYPGEIGEPYFKRKCFNHCYFKDWEIGEIFEYNDPHLLCNDANKLNDELSKVFIPDISKMIANQINAKYCENKLQLHDYETGNELYERRIKEIRSKNVEKHDSHQHLCTYEECVNKLNPACTYSEYHYNLWDTYDDEMLEEEIEAKIDENEKIFFESMRNKYYRGINFRSIKAYSESSNKQTTFQLCENWYSKVVPIESGNCLKDSLFKMREMILEKYSDVIDQIYLGVVNDEKEFTRLANSIDDHSISSLDYFPFLLSTLRVYFIDTDGHIVYRTGRVRSDTIGSFYTCFFVIEQNEDEKTGHISPVNFGILKEDSLPQFQYETKITHLYGDKNDDEGSAFWKDNKKTHKVFQHTFEWLHNGNNTVKVNDNIDNRMDFLRSRNGNLFTSSIAFDSAVDQTILDIYRHREMAERNDQIESWNGDRGNKKTDRPKKSIQNTQINERLIAGSIENILSDCIANDNNEYEWIAKDAEKKLNNHNDDNSVFRLMEYSENELNDPGLKKHLIAKDLEPFYKKYSHNDALIKSMSEQMRKESEKKFNSKQYDNGFCYKLLHVTRGKKDEKDNEFADKEIEFKVLVFFEYKTIGAMNIEGVRQSLLYHAYLKMKCNFVFVTNFVNWIGYTHCLENKRNVYELFYNDTIFLDKGFSHEELTACFGFNKTGKSLSNKGWKDCYKIMKETISTSKNIAWTRAIPVKNDGTYIKNVSIMIQGVHKIIPLHRFTSTMGLFISVVAIREEYKNIHEKYGEHQPANKNEIPSCAYSITDVENFATLPHWRGT